MNRLVLVGEANPYGGDPANALYHLPREASGNRLRIHLGLHDHTYAAIRKVNLCSIVWSTMEAVLAARAVVEQNEVVVCLGRKVTDAVARACGWEAPGFFSARKAARLFTLVSLPHPSGLSRPWNEPGARDKARVVLRAVAPHVPWGEVP